MVTYSGATRFAAALTVVLLPDKPLQAGQDLLPLLQLSWGGRQLVCKEENDPVQSNHSHH